MLQLKNIKKIYDVAENPVTALDGVSIDFRESEFVSILGPSGCGKTTLLNIVGGLDRYTDGDLFINGRSTKNFKDRDWDTYRNHSVGFVFQSYNLIPHQTVLANVELALTLSGISKAERRRRATEALIKVGLGDQFKKKPSQMSGGQMQRVAIARAIVNDPDILLADEPTGALDTTTSVQIMEILKEIAKDKLVIMVTHNPELAEQYSTRIVRLRDGQIIDDSMPFEAPAAAEEVVRKTTVKKGKKTSMSFWTAFTLSLNNLMTKKGRTFMTSFAGSIGIIGIALILALSNGINIFIATVQEDTLSTFPLTIQKVTQDYQTMLSSMMNVAEESDIEVDDNKIYVDDSMGTMISAMSATVQNDLVRFKAYIDEHYDELEPNLTAIKYTYDFDLQIYTEDGSVRVNPTTIFNYMGDAFAGMTELMDMSGMGGAFSVMSEMIDNQELLDQQYELIGEGSHWPENPNEVVLVIGSNNQISKMTLYMLGILPMEEIEEILKDLMMEGEYESSHMEAYDLNEFLGMKFQMLNTSDFYAKTEGARPYVVGGKEYPVWHDIRKLPGWEDRQADFVTENGTTLTISGIVRPREGVSATSISGAIGYTKELTDVILAMNTKSEVIAQQKATPHNNIFNGESFDRIPYTVDNINELIDKVGTANMETFYSYMTMMIRGNEEYSSMLEVNDETYSMFIATMDDRKQADTIRDMLETAQQNVAASITLPILFNALKNIPGGISTVDFTADNLVDLLPLMSMEQIVVLLTGIPQSEQIPMAISGLAELCGEEYMTALYADMNLTMKDWQINDKTFNLLLPAIANADAEQTDESKKLFPMIEQALYDMVPDKDATYDSILRELGDAELAAPASINFYAKDFESKDAIQQFISNYNDTAENETEKIKYTDTVGILMSSVTTIINAISYVLIAFVSISLVVSSIMIGIITYISVLERTKEIGILRAMGASKKDISRVFNAETLIIGLCAGIIGIVFTIIVCIPASAIIQHLTGIPTIAAILPWEGALILIAVSTFLTMLSGLIPSRSASRKDPVVALRTE
ncbi:MAG: ABC transporter ATP-binding protein/permease [Ruminococcaceae bacterium]|nr:ABC transporter ATP-binding protein/permease [Oscillospiraceae bacterium]